MSRLKFSRSSAERTMSSSVAPFLPIPESDTAKVSSKGV